MTTLMVVTFSCVWPKLLAVCPFSTATHCTAGEFDESGGWIGQEPIDDYPWNLMHFPDQAPPLLCSVGQFGYSVGLKGWAGAAQIYLSASQPAPACPPPPQPSSLSHRAEHWTSQLIPNSLLFTQTIPFSPGPILDRARSIRLGNTLLVRHRFYKIPENGLQLCHCCQAEMLENCFKG